MAEYFIVCTMLQSIHFKASLTTDAVRCDTPFNGTPLPIGFSPSAMCVQVRLRSSHTEAGARSAVSSVPFFLSGIATKAAVTLTSPDQPH